MFHKETDLPQGLHSCSLVSYNFDILNYELNKIKLSKFEIAKVTSFTDLWILTNIF